MNDINGPCGMRVGDVLFVWRAVSAMFVRVAGCACGIVWAD
jgi:hypothetical protein